ncbi:MAG: AAA family ATPase [Deltaproteobacteria bacterium]|nr:AAA family ATPase [Deltaproteobacteria bacterium]
MKKNVLNLNINSLQMENTGAAGMENFNKKMTESDKKRNVNASSIWCIGGGKGGIGKSFISSNLGTLLSMQSKRVLLVDADFGAANLHTFIECRQRMYSFSKFLKREGSNIRDVICKTSFDNVDLLSGANDVLDVADIKEGAMRRLIRELRNLDYDYILIDVGPGTSSHMLDLFLMSDQALLISTPEPTSIENTYRFLKALCLRQIKQLVSSGKDDELKGALCAALGMTGNSKAKTIIEIFERLTTLDNGRGKYLDAVIGEMDFSLIINQTKNKADENIGLQMKQACCDYFSIEMNYLGHIKYNETVGDSLRKRMSLVKDFSKSEPALLMKACLKKMHDK